MSSPPKEKSYRKLPRWKEWIAAGSSPSTPVSLSPSQTSIHAEGHGMNTTRTITPQPSGSLAGTFVRTGSPSFAGVRPAHVATPQDYTDLSNIDIPNLPGSPETSVLSSRTGDVTHVEHERYPSTIAHPSGTLGPVGGIDHIQEINVGATPSSSNSSQPPVMNPNSHPLSGHISQNLPLATNRTIADHGDFKSMWYKFPDGEDRHALKTPSFNQLMLWHQLWRSFRKGSPCGQRKALPDELIVVVMRYLGAVVPDLARTTLCTTPIGVRNRGVSATTQEWFRSSVLDRHSLSCISQMRLETFSHDQGWTTDRNPGEWSWFEIALLDSHGNVKGGLRRLTNDVAAVQNYDLALKDLDHKALVFSVPNPPSRDKDRAIVFVSHRNRLCSRGPMTHVGTTFGMETELWEHAREGDTISVRACARFDCWENWGYSAVLRVWKWFEPTIQ